MSSLLGLVLLLSTTLNNPNLAELNQLSEKADSKYIANTENTVILKVPYTHQIDDLPENKKDEIGTTACGPATIQMILNYFEDNYTLYQVIEKLPASVYVRGSMFYNLYDGPKQFGYDITKVKNNPENIFQTLKKGQPIILNIQNYDAITGHAVVIVGITEFDGQTAKSLIVHDPYVSAYRNFEYINNWQLNQPEGYTNYIGILEPFTFSRN